MGQDVRISVVRRPELRTAWPQAFKVSALTMAGRMLDRDHQFHLNGWYCSRRIAKSGEQGAWFNASSPAALRVLNAVTCQL